MQTQLEEITFVTSVAVVYRKKSLKREEGMNLNSLVGKREELCQSEDPKLRVMLLER
jgi:hypothetical protein